MDNWQYLVNTVGDLRFRRNDPDVIARVLEALSYVFEEKGETEALILMDEARDLRTNPTIVTRRTDEVAEALEEDEDCDDDVSTYEALHASMGRAAPEGNFNDLVRNLRWFMEKLK